MQPENMTDSINLAYQQFARYYHLLISGRDHAIKQANLLDRFIQNLSPRSRILDAACGAGDVLEMLATRHEHRLAGSDGSTAMLTYALQRQQLQGVPLSQCYFNGLTKLSSHQGMFDLIYFLGNAIAHSTNKKELLECLCQTWSALAPHGKVIFDFRDWVYSGELDQLIEPHRAIGQERQVPLGQSTQQDGERIEMNEICFYKDGRQFIEYRVNVQNSNEPQKTEAFTFSYLPFTKSEALEMLVKAGFQRCSILEPQAEYKYVVASGEKV